jgi:hypothetical protein
VERGGLSLNAYRGWRFPEEKEGGCAMRLFINNMKAGYLAAAAAVGMLVSLSAYGGDPPREVTRVDSGLVASTLSVKQLLPVPQSDGDWTALAMRLQGYASGLHDRSKIENFNDPNLADVKTAMLAAYDALAAFESIDPTDIAAVMQAVSLLNVTVSALDNAIQDIEVGMVRGAKPLGPNIDPGPCLTDAHKSFKDCKISGIPVPDCQGEEVEYSDYCFDKAGE